MEPKVEGTVALVAALFVMLTAMLDPRVSVGIAVVALAAFGVYRLACQHR